MAHRELNLRERRVIEDMLNAKILAPATYRALVGQRV